MRPVPNESKIPAGTLLVGKYRVTREIGRGGMAAVYEAEQTSLNKKVAVKVLASELSASSIVIERFFREARAAASVRSPYIVDVYDSGRLEDGRPFICMELLEGESLYDRMARLRLIDPETTVRIITQCAKGLAKAHGAGIVHRDLKPENIFIIKSEEGGEISKLLDFGLAKFYAPVSPDAKTARLTREGAVFGTPAYMSPEQVKGQGSVDHRADLWALGCMAFECLIGRPVWNTEQGVAMTFAAIATAPIPIPSKLRPDLPLAFDAWFLKALERDPDRRFQHAKELSDALSVAFEARAIGRGSLPSDVSDMEQTVALSHSGRVRDEELLAAGGALRTAYAGAGIGLAGSEARTSAEFLKESPTARRAALAAESPAAYAGGHPSLGTSVPDLGGQGRNVSLGSTSQVVPPPPPSTLRWFLSSAALI
ncbi:MAG TPA: serine/threonine-protein kinase, partial [Polyangiaceae bacterium]|nr:serine/threonine-protein kinase [Polyangiaceae bacterium]